MYYFFWGCSQKNVSQIVNWVKTSFLSINEQWGSPHLLVFFKYWSHSNMNSSCVCCVGAAAPNEIEICIKVLCEGRDDVGPQAVRAATFKARLSRAKQTKECPDLIKGLDFDVCKQAGAFHFSWLTSSRPPSHIRRLNTLCVTFGVRLLK